MAEPANKKVISTTMEFLDKIEKLTYRNGKTSIEISEEVKSDSQAITFPMRSFSPFYETFSERIQRLMEAGICPHRLAGSVLSSKMTNKRYDEEIPALVLSMDDLGVGFEVCMIPLALSAVVFVFELCYLKLKRLLRKYPFAMFVVVYFMKTSKPGV